MIRLAICVPTSGLVKSGFAASLVDLVRKLEVDRAFCREDPDFEFYVLFMSSSTIQGNRELLVQKALELECTHVLFIDDDMDFPPEAVELLFKRRRDIVICNYVMREKPLKATATKLNKEQMDFEGLLEPARFGGFGLALIRTEVFRKLPEPWFQPDWMQGVKMFSTEDSPFYRAAREAGYTIWVDKEASRLLGHIGTHVYRYKEE